jgi:hypothetical protein
MASADATRQAVLLRQLFDDLQMGFKDGQAVSIFNDNTGAIVSSKNLVHHNRSMHIALRHHFLHEQVTEGVLDLAHVPSVDNLAELLTKPLPAFQPIVRNNEVARRSETIPAFARRLIAMLWDRDYEIHLFLV